MNRSDEFPAGSASWPNELSRRRFIELMGASIALAGASGCTRNPPEHIVPYTRQPEEIVPGKPLYFATALTLSGFARGVLVETHEGRPTKIEGNPQHPATLGASDVFMQADLLALFDPERSQAVLRNGQISSWDAVIGELTSAARVWESNGGAGLRILTRHETSPTFLDQLRRLLAKYPSAKWHEHEPLGLGASTALYHFDRAEVIVSLGADFLCNPGAGLRYTRDFARGRRALMRMNRLYVAESTPTLTGAMADHRFVMSPSELFQFARDIESGSGREKIIADDLRSHAGRCVVVADELESIARRINQTLGNIGTTVNYLASDRGGSSLAELVDDIRSGVVETLVIISGNPAYDAPIDYEFAELLKKIRRTVHLDLYANETAALCHWHIPETHSLEAWSDARAFDGTATIMQPVIEPLFAGHSRHELLAAMVQDATSSSYDNVRRYWMENHGGDFEAFWRRSVHDGVVAGPSPASTIGSAPPPEVLPPAGHAGLQLLIRPSAQVYDGRYANNAWLQEFPDPFTTIVWDNAALVSPATATEFKLVNGDLVDLKFEGRSVRAPIRILPGQADNCITVHVGYGRTRGGSIATGIGFNAYALRTSGAMSGGAGLTLEKTGQSYDLVATQRHWQMEGRDQVRIGTAADFEREPDRIAKSREQPPADNESLYPRVDYTGHAWAMVIDLTTCIGCGACTIACQAENNIPVVGREQVSRGREMHWIRVDRYFETGLTNAWTLHQPVPCMHCENAPCELVCPVAATVHSSEGLNQMVYNRCIGTRYCSNNCPYKVRRFNFLEYDANRFEQPATRKLMRNPNVSVRSRGVMEKCTYCIQRINAVKIEAEKASRTIRDGEITPACAQTCPAEAIVFGDLNDPASRVAALRKSPLNYGLLAELNTRPRTTYLARLCNPNPAFEQA